MENSEIHKHIFNLGKALVEQLGIDPGVDTLSRWMAHYVAEQITLAENATGKEKSEAENECFETILKLWHHRAYYPNGQQPFKDFELIYRTLERLVPENPNPFFYSIKTDDTNKESSEVQQWLDIALSIDEAARVWLEYVFHQAALNASDDRTLTWLENAMSLPESDDVQIVNHILEINNIDDNEGDLLQEARIRQVMIESRIKKLDGFIQFSQILRAEFADELELYTDNNEISVEKEN